MNELDWIKNAEIKSQYYAYVGSLYLSNEDLKNYPLESLEKFCITIEKEGSKWICYTTEHFLECQQEIMAEQDEQDMKELVTHECKVAQDKYFNGLAEFEKQFESEKSSPETMTEIEVKVNRIKIHGFTNGTQNYGYTIKICKDQLPASKRSELNSFWYECGEANPHYHCYTDYFFTTEFLSSPIGSDERSLLFKECRENALNWGDNLLREIFPELKSINKPHLTERLWIELPQILPDLTKKLKVTVPFIP